MRLRTLLAAATVTLAVASPAVASTPATGTLSEAKPLLKWTGEAASGIFNVTPVADMRCDAPFCDTYALTLPEKGTFEVSITAQTATGFTDLILIDPAGERTRITTGSGEKTASLLLDDAAPGLYTVQALTNTLYIPGVATGPFSGRAKLILPPVLPPAA